MVPSINQLPKSDRAKLVKRARRFIAEYPDLYSMAHGQALNILKKHTDRSLDPDRVYWHRFSNASTSPRTFTGWEHVGPPVESMTLTQLVMHRFNAGDQDASDELQVYGGFYTVGADHDLFDENNEVPVLPQQILQDFWALDFEGACLAKLEQFWVDQSEDFLTLAKVRWLSAAGSSLRDGSLSLHDFQTVLRAVLGSSDAVLTLGRLQASVEPPAGITLHTFDIAGRAARDIVRIVDPQQRQILYLPGEAAPFQAFDNEQQLYQWVRSRVADKPGRTTFTEHFLRSAAAREQGGAAFDTALEQLIAEPWNPDNRLINQDQHPIAGDVFVYLREAAHQEMQADAHFLLTSNADLRKQIWIGYLSAFLRAFGPAAALGWPVALTVVGAGIANVGLNIDQAVNGVTARQRKAGLVGAILNAIFVCLNLPLLAWARSGRGLVVAAHSANEVTTSAEVSAFELRVWPEDIPTRGPGALEGLEDPVVLNNAEAMGTTGKLRGIHQLRSGHTAINLGGRVYRVRFDQQQRWGIVHPDRPFAFYGFKPVRLNAAGEWELAPPLGLSGGSPMDPAGPSASMSVPSTSAKRIDTVRSPFWDTYMQFNLAEERRLSTLALHRQEVAMQVFELESGDEVISDSDGEEVHIDPWGEKHYVFRTADDVYVGRHLKRYTEEDIAYNQFLRTGQPHSSDQVTVIEELTRDLKRLALNNDVALYRGGSGDRGTSGRVFRSGRFKPGDVLVNTDITSFSENPYIARVFSSTQAGEASASFMGEINFDDSSIVFVLPAQSYVGATPIAPFSWSATEAESVFLPGHYFRIDEIDEVTGPAYRFIRVQLREVPKSESGQELYDLRTGAPFSRDSYAIKLGPEAKGLVDLFFPAGD
ncbi:MAG: hypothetical protein JWQ69_5005 [Pseudomonas sp.]|nr:hypothetical protein [Pseudomonas sp.]